MRRALAAALGACLCLVVASPPAPFPGAEWLVVPGLALYYAVASGASRPYLLVGLIGAVQLLVVSWSLRHVTLGGTIGIGLLAGLYSSVIIAGWTRAGGRWRLGGVWFGLGVAAFAWLRTHQPEIPYPHAQPVHALWAWPRLLGVVQVGGEPLGNLLLAWTAAGAVDLWRSWRVAEPSRVRAIALFATGVLGFAVCVPLGQALRAPDENPATARVVAIQPGPFGALSDRNAFRRWGRERLGAPTAEVAGPEVAAPPDLVAWPESTLPQWITGDPPRLSPADAGIRLHQRTSLVAGTVRDLADGGRVVAAVQVDARNRLVDWHEKLVPVPGGERLPFARFLPESWQRWLVAWGTSLTQDVPDLRAGTPRSPLITASGVPYAALTCFDNAFDSVARDAVASGARLLVVLSNESWYQQGAELDQMVAMSVCRALETGTPMVRATIDGDTCAVAADGRIVAGVPRGDGPAVLDVRIDLGPGRAPPLAWLSSLLGVAALGGGLLLFWRRPAR